MKVYLNRGDFPEDFSDKDFEKLKEWGEANGVEYEFHKECYLPSLSDSYSQQQEYESDYYAENVPPRKTLKKWILFAVAFAVFGVVAYIVVNRKRR